MTDEELADFANRIERNGNIVTTTSSVVVDIIRELIVLRAEHRIVKEWWEDGDRPPLPNKHWSSHQVNKLIQRLGRLMEDKCKAVTPPATGVPSTSGSG